MSHSEESLATYRAVYAAMPCPAWPLFDRMGTWRGQRAGHIDAGEMLLTQHFLGQFTVVQ